MDFKIKQIRNLLRKMIKMPICDCGTMIKKWAEKKARNVESNVMRLPTIIMMSSVSGSTMYVY